MTDASPLLRLTLVVALMAGAACSKGGAPGAPSRGTWAKIAAAGRAFTAPPSWTVTDPLAGTQQPSERGWCRSLPSTSMAAARVTAPQGTTTALLLHGPAGDLGRFVQACLDERRADTKVKFDETFRTTTASGAEVMVQVGHRDPAKSGEPAVTWLLGQATRDDRMVVIDAGGPTAAFDRPAVMTLIGSVSF